MGYIRYEHGNWKGGFVRRVGNCEVLMAELLVVIFGLNLSVEKGLSRVVNLDSEIVVHLLTNF